MLLISLLNERLDPIPDVRQLLLVHRCDLPDPDRLLIDLKCLEICVENLLRRAVLQVRSRPEHLPCVFLRFNPGDLRQMLRRHLIHHRAGR